MPANLLFFTLLLNKTLLRLAVFVKAKERGTAVHDGANGVGRYSRNVGNRRGIGQAVSELKKRTRLGLFCQSDKSALFYFGS
ncbi:hypothetical protein SDC9_154288 [bioreactor metagenome]|uniref:Uncharacterized protein n=1 Tax=bioreactor metagenome TaxID=1076179 RepID=A0A645F0S2_9ZZZZ